MIESTSLQCTLLQPHDDILHSRQRDPKLALRGSYSLLGLAREIAVALTPITMALIWNSKGTVRLPRLEYRVELCVDASESKDHLTYPKTCNITDGSTDFFSFLRF